MYKTKKNVVVIPDFSAVTNLTLVLLFLFSCSVIMHVAALV